MDIKEIFVSNQVLPRTLRGPAKPSNDDEDPDDVDDQGSKWHDQVKQVKVYDGSSTPLVGCRFPNNVQAVIHVEAYFWPEWNVPANWEDGSDELDSEGRFWMEKERLFLAANTEFAKDYANFFPDAIGGKEPQASPGMKDALRTFPCLGLHPDTQEPVPLTTFLTVMDLPKEMQRPATMLHWISNITFQMSSRQQRSKMISQDMWRDPQTFIHTKVGTPQDHAILLCSALLSHFDAYVVKGTIRGPDQKVVEHVWVMTRDETGWITFWEPSTREMYHLPKRWSPHKRKVRPPKEEKNKIVDEEDSDGDKDEALEARREALEAGHVEDVQVKADEDLPTVGRAPRPKQRAMSAQSGRNKTKQDLMEKREKLPTAPKPELLKEKGTLVDWLPYDSIDVVFNNQNIWANHQNHHPACITYDFEECKTLDDDKTVDAQDSTQAPGWLAFLTEEEKQTRKLDPINFQVITETSWSHKIAVDKQEQLIGEVCENIRLLRSKNGLDSNFDQRPQLHSQLELFIYIHETVRSLDIDCCPIFDKKREDWTKSEAYLFDVLLQKQERYNRHGSVFKQRGKEKGDADVFKEGLCHEERKRWASLLRQIEEFRKRKNIFPTKKEKKFDGFPLHFNTTAKDTIRHYLMANEEFGKMIKEDSEDALLTVYCKVFPLLGGFSSTWFFFGIQLPLD